MAYYAVLAAKGFLTRASSPAWAGFASRLGGHPDRTLVPGVEISSGSLGHGLGLAVGMALGLGLQGRTRPAGRRPGRRRRARRGQQRRGDPVRRPAGLDRLTAVVVDNESAQLGWPGGIAARFEVEGWRATDVDGHNRGALRKRPSHRCAATAFRTSSSPTSSRRTP